jgi:hypothetical protein
LLAFGNVDNPNPLVLAPRRGDTKTHLRGSDNASPARIIGMLAKNLNPTRDKERLYDRIFTQSQTLKRLAAVGKQFGFVLHFRTAQPGCGYGIGQPVNFKKTPHGQFLLQTSTSALTHHTAHRGGFSKYRLS